jgi:hypothetical protein
VISYGPTRFPIIDRLLASAIGQLGGRPGAQLWFRRPAVPSGPRRQARRVSLDERIVALTLPNTAGRKALTIRAG